MKMVGHLKVLLETLRLHKRVNTEQSYPHMWKIHVIRPLIHLLLGREGEKEAEDCGTVWLFASALEGSGIPPMEV